MRYRFEQPAVDSAAALAALKAETFSEAFAAANDPAELAAHLARAFAVDAVSAQLLDPRCDTTWVLDDGKPVGYLKVNYGTAQSVPGLSDGLEVEQLYVLASHHGQGLGGQLLDLATEKARERGLTYLWLGVGNTTPTPSRSTATAGTKSSTSTSSCSARTSSATS
jgi:diamine N-acetyltransferase